MQRSLAIAAFVAAALASAPGPSAAEEGEHALVIAPEYAALVGAVDRHGVGARLGYEYGLTDFWALDVEATWAWHFDDVQPEQVGMALAGIRYNIDAFEWVPYATLLVGGVLFVPDSVDPNGDFAICAGVGVDYRRWRSFAIGVDARYHAFVSNLDEIPAYITAGARVVFYFE